MLSKLFKFAIAKGIGGPARSWIFTSGFAALFRFAKGKTGRRETLDLSATKPGDKIVIEHLDITHKQQIKQFKGEKKVEKRTVKAGKALDKRSIKADNARTKQLKRDVKASKARAKQVKRSVNGGGSARRRIVKADRAQVRQLKKELRRARKS